jgi:hypothetical protein
MSKSKKIFKLNFFVCLLLDAPHELLSTELGSKAPTIVIHTCDDNDAGNNIGREKLIKPTIMQTKRPPKIEEHI